jgi:uncharacterized protein
MQDFIVFDDIDKHGPQSFKRTYDISAADLSRDEVVGIGPVTIEVSVKKSELAAEYVADGSVAFALDLECARCTEPYPFAIPSGFHLRFRPRPDAAGDETEEVEISPEDLDVEFYSERTIPLRDLAIEQIQLMIPMKPLCDETCLGLCPKCGIDRNRETCTCEETAGDERWGALVAFREGLLKKRES